MGVKDMTIDTASIEAALFRSTGVAYAGMQYGPATDPTKRPYNATGKGRGHVYMHGADKDPQSNTAGPAHKSRFENHTTMVGVIVDILKSTKGQQALAGLDANPTADGVWLHGSSGLPVSGNWYGFEQGSAVKKKIIKASINMRAHGDALFITSAYPEDYQTNATAAATP
jgi:hypothetical protein